MKRFDIQGLRCICIVMVLLYHYYPEYFPQGRLGVDMFFVISGFLIALMLSKKKDGFFTYCTQFYWRRVKRILPLCYLVFCISFIAMYALRLETFISVNKTFGKRALVFMANVKMSDEDQYEAQLSGATILLTHYWSLSTEVQFYFLAPFLVILVRTTSTTRKTIYFTFLSSLSLLHYVTTSEGISFNSPLARLWQFLAGFIAYYNCKPNDRVQREASCPLLLESECKKLEGKTRSQQLFNIEKGDLVSWVCLLTLLISTFVPTHNRFVDTVFRVTVTLATSWIVGAAGNNPKFLEHRLLVYMGDISFALYLVHWPILCFVKTFAEDSPFWQSYGILVAFVTSVGLSIVLHEGFEKRYLKWGAYANIATITCMILACCAVVFVNYDNRINGLPPDEFFANAILENIKANTPLDAGMQTQLGKIVELDNFDDPGRHRLWKMPNGTGNLTVLILGNSFAVNHADNVYEGLKEISSTMYVYWNFFCEALVTTDMEGEMDDFCVEKPMKNAELVALLKPDLLFIAERGFLTKKELAEPDLMDRQYRAEMEKNLGDYEKFAKRIFILGPVPSLIKNPMTKALSYLKNSQRLRDSPSLIKHQSLPRKRRFKDIPKMCKTCVVYEWEQFFYNSANQFVPYDQTTDVLYFDDQFHLGAHGDKKMTPFYKDLGKRIQSMREKNELLL